MRSAFNIRNTFIVAAFTLGSAGLAQASGNVGESAGSHTGLSGNSQARIMDHGAQLADQNQMNELARTKQLNFRTPSNGVSNSHGWKLIGETPGSSNGMSKNNQSGTGDENSDLNTGPSHQSDSDHTTKSVGEPAGSSNDMSKSNQSGTGSEGGEMNARTSGESQHSEKSKSVGETAGSSNDMSKSNQSGTGNENGDVDTGSGSN